MGETLQLMADTTQDHESPSGRWALKQRVKGIWKTCCSQKLSL